jgi:aldehyde:ferredoxin oxidoreductase
MAGRGYFKKMLRVDLGKESTWTEDIDDAVLERHLGGKGLAAHYFTREVDPDANPLGPSNRVYLSAGPMQGTDILSAGRVCVTTKSPLTNIYLDSFAGGMFGHGLRFAGFELAAIDGVAEEPVYILIKDGKGEVKTARRLWGKGTMETERALKAVHGKDCSVISAGPAGENRVLFACLITDMRRAAGRGGAGAVFGSKRLKAVVVAGKNKPSIANKDIIRKINKESAKAVRDARQAGDGLVTIGTSRLVKVAQDQDRLPTRNFQSGVWEEWEGLSGEKMVKDAQVLRDRCCNCMVSCVGRIGKDEHHRPEYETLAMLGSNLGLKFYGSVVQSNDLCNDLGLDTISTGNVLGFAMEASEKKLIPQEIEFGRPDQVLHLVQMIAMRQDMGNTLADGVMRLAKSIGPEAEKIAIHVKGLELPAWDPRGKLGQGLAYMTSEVGASHLRDFFKYLGPANASALDLVPFHVRGQNKVAVRNSYILCYFVMSYTTYEKAMDLYTAVTGLEMTDEKMMECGNRMYTLIRDWNNRAGMTRLDDRLPPRLKDEPLPSGPGEGCKAFVSDEDMEACLDKYYELRGWDKNGVPTPTTKQELGIE